MVHPVYSLHGPLRDRLMMWWKCLSLTTSLISKYLCYVSLSRLNQRFTKHMKQRTTSSTQYLQLTLCLLNGLKVYRDTACLKQSRMTLMMLSADSGETTSTESCSFFSSHWQIPCFYLAFYIIRFYHLLYAFTKGGHICIWGSSIPDDIVYDFDTSEVPFDLAQVWHGLLRSFGTSSARFQITCYINTHVLFFRFDFVLNDSNRTHFINGIIYISRTLTR